MAFREVGVHEIREVLRLWLRGEGFRSVGGWQMWIARRSGRYVAAATACGLDRDGGEGQLGDELLGRVCRGCPPAPGRRARRALGAGCGAS